ncbi:putative membrane protein [Helicobacter pylori Hp P-11]|nr:putative membrane protein [Helicobacter pylori Hp P-11]
MGLLFLRGFSGVWSLGFIFLSLIFILSFISCLFLISCVLSFIFCEMHIRE